MVDRWLRLNPQVRPAPNQTMAQLAQNLGAPAPLPQIIYSGAPTPVNGAASAIIKINGDGSVEFPADPYANGDDTYTLWERSSHSLVLRKRYQGSDPNKFFVFVIVTEDLTDKNEVFINCWQLCQYPADAIAFDVEESHRRQTAMYISACKLKGIEPDWGEHTEQIELAAEAEAQENAWDTFVAENPGPAKEEA